MIAFVSKVVLNSNKAMELVFDNMYLTVHSQMFATYQMGVAGVSENREL